MIEKLFEISDTKYVYLRVIGSNENDDLPETVEDAFLLSNIFMCTNKNKTIVADWCVGSSKIFVFTKSNSPSAVKRHPILKFCKDKYEEYETGGRVLNFILQNGTLKEVFELLQQYADNEGKTE